MTVGEAIRQAREAAGWTQVELAKRANIHRTYLNQLEHGRKSPSLDIFMQICEALKIRPSKIIAQIERTR